jgi:serum/glucocorticoid-regulated kinase 2
MISVIGKGGYAKVVLVRKNKNNKIFALKILKKKLICKNNLYKNKKNNVFILLQSEMF